MRAFRNSISILLKSGSLGWYYAGLGPILSFFSIWLKADEGFDFSGTTRQTWGRHLLEVGLASQLGLQEYFASCHPKSCTKKCINPIEGARSGLDKKEEKCDVARCGPKV